MVGSFLQKKMMKTNDLERQEVIRSRYGRNLWTMCAGFSHYFSRHHHNWKL